MMWSDFYEAGGWGMYPTSVSAVALVAVGVLFLLRPERRFLTLLAILGVFTFGAGVLGTCVGIDNTLHYIQPLPAAEQIKVAALGCAESLNNLVLAFILINFTSLLAAIGALRAARARASASA